MNIEWRRKGHIRWRTASPHNQDVTLLYITTGDGKYEWADGEWHRLNSYNMARHCWWIDGIEYSLDHAAAERQLIKHIQQAFNEPLPKDI